MLWARLSVFAVGAAGLLAMASCGGGGDGENPLDDALGYLPENTALAAAISTDLDSQPYQDLDVALQRFGVEGGLDSVLEELDEEGLSFSRDVAPLLGNDLVVGVPADVTITGDDDDPRVIAAIRTSDGDAVRELLGDLGLEGRDEVEGASVYGPPAPELPEAAPEGLDPVPGGGDPESVQDEGPAIAVDGDTVVAAESLRGLEEALRQRTEDDRLTEDVFADRLGDLSGEALIKVTGDVPAALEALGIEQVASEAWIGSLRSFGLAAEVNGRVLSVDGELTGEEVPEDELPLATGSSSPKMVAGEPSVANRDQAQSLDFALEVVKAAAPQAALESVVDRVESDFGGSVSALADQFGEGILAEIGPGEGEEQTVSRTEVQDPATVTKAVRALREEVLQLAQVTQLDSPASEVVEAARAFIPALPVPEDQSFPTGSKVEAVRGEPALYRLVAAAPEDTILPAGARPEEFVFGVVGGVFVTGPTVEAAKRAAGIETVAHQGPGGAFAATIPLTPSDLDLPSAEGADVAVTTIEAGIEATPTGLRLQLEAGL